MNNMIVIGDRASPKERKIIRDDEGEIEVDVGFDTSEDCYELIGICRVNGDIYHYYQF